MNIITLLFNEILYRPLLNALIFLYNTIPLHDFGVSLIILTVIIRVILYPLSQKAIKSQKELQVLQPKIKEIQQKYKGDREKQSVALMELYKTHKVNPASGCLPILIQLPVLVALYSVLRNGLNPNSLSALYHFVHHPGVVNPIFLGLIDLSKKNIILGVLAGATQFLQTKMMMPKNTSDGSNDFAAAMNKQMLYLFPVFLAYLAYSFGGGLALYWTVYNIFAIIQQYIGLKKKNGQTN